MDNPEGRVTRAVAREAVTMHFENENPLQVKSMNNEKNGSAGLDSVPDAATVVLLREGAEGMEVFLMRRHRRQSFMGGAHVFPGGRVDEGDSLEELTGFIHDYNPQVLKYRLQEPLLSEDGVRGLYMAAIRETFEESGVLLARENTGNAVVSRRPQAETAGVEMDTLRYDLHGGTVSLADVALRLDIRYDPGLLIPYAHWITPEVEKTRFNTRFFLAPAPSNQVATHDNLELTESLWITPACALEMHNNGDMVLMPPTLKTIEEINEYSSAETFMEKVRARTIYPILPQAFIHGDDFGVLLPHDPEYTIPDFKQPARPGETSRIIMAGGIWRTAAG